AGSGVAHPNHREHAAEPEHSNPGSAHDRQAAAARAHHDSGRDVRAIIATLLQQRAAPSLHWTRSGPLAQSAEQWAFNPWVQGSIPWRPTPHTHAEIRNDRTRDRPFTNADAGTVPVT